VAQLGTESFLGDAVIEFVPGNVPQRGKLLVGGDTIDNIRVKPNPIEVVDVVIDLKDRVGEAVDSVRRAADTVDAAGQGITRVADQIETAMGDENSDLKVILTNIRQMTENADRALASFNSVMGRFDEFLNDPEFQGELKETIKGLPEFFDNAQQTLTEARGAIEKFKEVGARAEGNLSNIEDFTKALGENGPEILETLKSSLGGVDRLVKNIDEFSLILKNNEGTFGRLFNDPALYDNLNETLANLREITTRVKPIVGDLRVFADSLARDPGQLGVRGALQKRPAGSGYKGTGATEASRTW
jgi:phospholipid/cholesterol/gamma-HCH transport system substrate-binding protein